MTSAIKTEIEDINTLKTSTDCNHQQKQEFYQQLAKLSKEAKDVMDLMANGQFNKEEQRYLELVVQSHVYELQNNELEINLTLRAKINERLSDKLKVVKNTLKQNGIGIFEDEEESEDHKPVIKTSLARQASAYSGRTVLLPKKLPLLPPGLKHVEAARAKRMSTIIEKSHQDSSMDGEGPTVRRINNLKPIKKILQSNATNKADSLDPMRAIEVKGNNFLSRLPTSKHVIKSSNSPSRPKLQYPRDDFAKEDSLVRHRHPRNISFKVSFRAKETYTGNRISWHSRL